MISGADEILCDCFFVGLYLLLFGAESVFCSVLVGRAIIRVWFLVWNGKSRDLHMPISRFDDIHLDDGHGCPKRDKHKQRWG